MPSRKRFTRVRFTPHAQKIYPLRLQTNLVPQINRLIPQVLLAPQILPSLQPQRP